MPRVYLVQLLCPQRHCIVCCVYEERPEPVESQSEVTRAELREFAEEHLDPWCGICGSRQLTFEDALTRFRSIEEALPELEKVTVDNRITALILAQFVKSEGDPH